MPGASRAGHDPSPFPGSIGEQTPRTDRGHDAGAVPRDRRQACVTPHAARDSPDAAINGRPTRPAGDALARKHRKKIDDNRAFTQTDGVQVRLLENRRWHGFGHVSRRQPRPVAVHNHDCRQQPCQIAPVAGRMTRRTSPWHICQPRQKGGRSRDLGQMMVQRSDWRPASAASQGRALTPRPRPPPASHRSAPGPARRHERRPWPPTGAHRPPGAATPHPPANG